VNPLLASLSPHLPASAAERLKQVPVRVLLALLLGWSLHTAGRNEWIAPWLVIAAIVQLFEICAMSPFRRPGADRASGLAKALAVAAILAMSAIHGGMVVLLWMTALPVLVTVALLMLCGGLLNNIASATNSRPLFLIGAIPYIAPLPILPLEAFRRGEGQHVPLLVMGVILFVFAILAVWKRTNAAHAAEITALAQAERRLEEAEAAIADRAAMAAIVSHELRTPVSAILAGAQVIKQGAHSERITGTADLIVDASRLMTGMLNDLLDHSKIEARAMTLDVRDFDLKALLDDTARFWDASAAAKGLTLDCRSPTTQWLKGDPFRIRQILNNLISNAVKFTEQGGVAITATVSDAPGGRRVSIRVLDQGQGIAADAMQRLFAPFAQGSAEVARTYGGTGLGLTVSRDLARLMGGELTAENASGGGASFTLEVVLPDGEPCDTAIEDGPAPRLERSLRVLAVDDHEINRRTLSIVLQPLDVELATASSGQAALELLASRPFDVILMDVNMPGIDGNETTRRLRASGGLNAGVPVIGFSAGTEAAQIAACRVAGMTDWLPKPLEPQRLYMALERAVTAETASA